MTTPPLDLVALKRDVTMRATHVRLKLDLTTDLVSAMDEWSITLLRDGKRLETTFFTGIGHRREPRMLAGGHRPTPGRYSHPTKPDISASSIYRTELGRMPGSVLAAVEDRTSPVSPKFEDVLAAISSDAASVLSDDTFYDWVESFGKDADSREALDIYLACQRTLRDMRKFFGYDTTLALISHEW